MDLSFAVNIIHDCIARNNSIWIMGNGGSASTAEHFETDLHFIKHGEKIRIGAQSLSSNSSLITAIGNDIGFEEVFRHQLIRKSKKKDLVILISASGNSCNKSFISLSAIVLRPLRGGYRLIQAPLSPG